MDSKVARAKQIVKRLEAIKGTPPGPTPYPEELRPRANCFLYALAIRPPEWRNLTSGGLSPFLQVPVFSPIVNELRGMRSEITESTDIMPITEGVLHEVVRLGSLSLGRDAAKLSPKARATDARKTLPLIVRPSDVIDGALPASPKMGFYRIAVYASERDFHFARQFRDGATGKVGWVHKAGQTKRKFRDSNDALIANPQSAVMEVGGVKYRYVGQLYVVDHATRDRLQQRLGYNPLVRALIQNART